MLPSIRLVPVALALLGAAPVAAQEAQDAYDRAFRLEHEDRAFGEAMDLYRKVAENRGADEALRARAHYRAHAMAEELASADFAALMPGDAIFYMELSNPGAQLASLLDQLGLLASWDEVVSRGASSFSVSPDLIQGLFGARGVAVAIDRVPMGGGPPGGVLVAHAGDLQAVRGLLETAIPAGGVPGEPIEGHPTWSIEDQAHVAMTSRLLVVSSDREGIAGVLKRLKGDQGDSLANSPTMRDHLALRRDDLFFFCVNAVPLRPMIAALIQEEAKNDPEVAMISQVLDIESVEALVGRGGVQPDGLSMDVRLRLDEGHRNLAFNFLRSAPLDGDTLSLVPEGAAAFASWSYNPRGSSLTPLEVNADGEPVVTAMDLGREFFANIVGVAVFALPSDGEGSPIPDVALAIGANDPARSRAIWNLGLGLANLAGGGVTMEPGTVDIAGLKAERYHLPNGFPLYLATDGSGLILSPSRGAIERAIAARETGRSVLQDPAFAGGLARIDEGTVSTMMVHLGRAVQMAEAYVPPSEMAELGPMLALLDRTVLAATSTYSANEAGFSLSLSGMPKVDGLVAQVLAEQRARGEAYAVAYSGDGEKALHATEKLLKKEGGDAELMRRKFDLLVERGDADTARELGAKMAQHVDDARFLNNFAWALLTEERYGERFDLLALKIALASNEANGYSTWQYVDTLALAKFRQGDVDGAIELELRAIELAPDGSGKAEMEASLARFRAARAEHVAGHGAS